jgi:predicted adenylyl cyclase CyaB
LNRNIEIKARVEDLEALEGRVRVLADRGPVVLDQEDTFFSSPRGRLKLRRLSDTEGELIFYERPDTPLPVESGYAIASTAAPDDLLDVLAGSIGVIGVVRKRRLLYLIGQTRVHLDRVEGLGDFMELEVVMRGDQSGADCVGIAQHLMAKLEIPEAALVAEAYIDLLSRGEGQ